MTSKLNCRTNFSGDFFINGNVKRRKRKRQRRAWSEEVKAFVEDVTRSCDCDWVSALPAIETALNSTAVFKDIDGKSPVHIDGGEMSCWQTRDPEHPDGLNEKGREDCFELYTRVMNYRQCPCCQGQSCRELDRLFGVKFANRLECPGCKNEWLAGEAQQHFLDIGLPAADPQTTTVQALVNKVFCVNKYEYACVGCGKQRKDVNVRQVLIDASPRLVLRLKRWSGDPDMPGRKNRCAVKFTLSEKLTLTQQSSEHLTYVLKSAVVST
ncbi:Hypp8414 [Branchiostoma lanceolatum]|uniref:Hypp8414 protein n=1 Tax=Branchiostoma lanceolatum TaxID=7740 RepID=A0A8J9Z8K0_BRALA|nr:Hypp8414 [Branchiostoma lanceolatum]